MRRKFLSFTVVLMLLVVFGCAPKTKAHLGFEKPQYNKVPAELMSRIASAGDAFDYPDANSIVIENVDSSVYNEDGSQVQYSYYLIKPITPQGLKDNTTEELGYDSQMFQVDILYAAVIHPDSTIEFVPDSSIIDQVASEGMAEADIYWTNLRKKIVRFPQLNSGDAIAIAYRYKMFKPYFEGVISGISGFQTSEPIHKNRSVNLIPKSKAEEIHYKILNDKKNWIKFREYDTDKYRAFVWEADSTPALVMETGMPPATMFIPLVMFSNVTWKELSRKAWDITEPPMKIEDPEIKSTVKAIVETCKTEYDSIRAIGLWVAQNIRYIGLSLGDKEGITPHDVNETFKAECGVCKDKSALAVAMLREAGIDAYNVLTNPVGHVIYDIAVQQFNHQIVMAKMRDGKEIFIDVTDDICRDLLPGYYSKKGYLVLSKSGTDLKYFPIIPPEKNLGRVDIQSRIDGDGNLHSTVNISGVGLYDEVIRQLGQYLEKEDQKRLFRRMITQIDPNAVLVDATIEPQPASRLSIPAEITIKYKVPEYAVVAGDFLLLSIPSATHIFDVLSNVLGEYTKLEERHYPLRFMYTYGVDVNEKIELAQEYEPKSIPVETDIQNKYLAYNMNYNFEGKIVDFQYSLRLNDIDIPLKDYNAFRDAVSRYENSAKGMLILNREAK